MYWRMDLFTDVIAPATLGVKAEAAVPARVSTAQPDPSVFVADRRRKRRREDGAK